MKQRTPAFGIVCAVAFLGACNSSDGVVPASTYLDNLGDHIGQMADALETHSANIHAAKSLSGMMGMESQHATETAELMGDMLADMDGMASCADSAGHMADGGMEQRMAAAKTECDQHMAAMMAAPDTMAAEDEETRHHGAMSDLIGKMKAQQAGMADQGMMGGGSMPMCSMGQ